MDYKQKEILQKFSALKIELGSFQEIKEKGGKLRKALQDADDAWRKHSDYLTGADKTYDKMISAYNELNASVQFAEGAYKRFEKGAKELGVDPMSSKEFKEMKQDIKESDKVFGIINRFDSPDTFN